MSAALIADKLRASLLQAAIQGKLTKQLAEDGDARDLLKAIEAEKARLIEEKIIKKEKPLLPITDEEIPFEIPENWVWVRLQDIFNIVRGGSPRPIQQFITTKEDGINWIKIGDTDIGGKYINNVREKIRPEGIKSSRFVHQGDLLLTNSMSYGRPYILNVNGCIHDGWLAFSPYVVTISKEFFYYLLSSYFVKNQFNNTVAGAVVKNLNRDKVKEVFIPLPPLSEQHRIVEAIETALAKIDKLKTDETKLYEIQKAFPNKLRASLLQSAIQGQLTEQLPEDGNARDLLKEIEAEKARLIEEKIIKKEKPLPPITEDEIPFEIPENWAWVRFGSIVINRDAERIPLSKDERSSHKKIYDYYGASGVIDQVNDFIFDEELLLIGEDGANLLTRSKPIAFIANGKYWVNNHAHVLQPCIDIRYLAFYINAIPLHPYVTGTAQPKMNQEKMNSILVSIPPLAEQERIVKKLDEILGRVDGLKKITQ